jgi:Spy/CpxP family protein refolding chaperone
MRQTFRRLAIALCLMTLALTGTALAEDTKELELTRQEIQTNRQELVTEFLKLTDQESEKFWPLYKKYRSEMGTLNDQVVNLVTSYTQNSDTLSNQQARKLLDDYLKYQDSRLKLQKKYVNEFADVLPPKKLVRYFQLENKMDAVVMLGLAGSVPLVQ